MVWFRSPSDHVEITIVPIPIAWRPTRWCDNSAAAVVACGDPAILLVFWGVHFRTGSRHMVKTTTSGPICTPSCKLAGPADRSHSPLHFARFSRQSASAARKISTVGPYITAPRETPTLARRHPAGLILQFAFPASPANSASAAPQVSGACFHTEAAWRAKP